MTKDEDKAARLAAALRTNLRRRKAQAREGAQEKADGAAVPVVPPGEKGQ